MVKLPPIDIDSMLPQAVRQIFALDRAQLRARSSLPCMVTIAGALLVGLLLSRPGIGMVAAGGAMSVGMGSYQQVGHSRLRPMLWATVGMACWAVLGSAVGHSGPGAILVAGLVGYIGGLLLALGAGAAWVGQQCAIAALVAGGYPVGLDTALSRGLLLLAGGLTQTGLVAAYWQFRPAAAMPAVDDTYTGFPRAIQTLRENLSLRTTPGRYALRLGLTLAVGAGLAHYLGLRNGYWLPMTALIVTKPDLQQTIYRGLARNVGTLIGAIVASVLVGALRPTLPLLAALIVVFAWMAYSTVTVNYAAFSISLTAYIVFLLAFAGLPPGYVVVHRTINTAAGGGLAVLSYVTAVWVRRRHPPEASPAVLAAARAHAES